MKKQVDQWLSLAEKDLKSAILLSEDETLTSIAAFHCQQAVEKGFKAILENNNERIPKIHNLEILYERSKPIISIALDLEMLQKINEVYIDSRYPGDIGLTPIGIPSLETISSFIRFTEKLLKDLRKAADE